MEDTYTINYLVPRQVIKVLIDIIHSGIDDEVAIYNELVKRMSDMNISIEYVNLNSFKRSNLKQYLDHRYKAEDWWMRKNE